MNNTKSNQIAHYKGIRCIGTFTAKTSGSIKESKIDREELNRQCQKLNDEVASGKDYRLTGHGNLQHRVCKDKINNLAESLELTTTDILRLTTLSSDMFQNAMRGNRIRVTTLEAIAKALGVDKELILN